MNRKPLPVPRYLLEIISSPPRHWTIVPAPKSTRRTAAYLGQAYAVCPGCRYRMAFRGRPKRMPCEHCKVEFDVDWDETYLG